MNHISLFLDKYRDIEKSIHGEKDLICKTIYEVTGILVAEDKIDIKSDQARIKVTPGQRSVMLERKEELLKALSSKLKQNISKIV